MAKAEAQVGGTQSFVHTMTKCWRRPSLTALEVAWRWVYGIPACWLIVTHVQRLLQSATGGTMDPARLGLDRVLLNDPVGALSVDPLGASAKFANAIALVKPDLLALAAWMLPLLAVAWLIVSSLGRTVVLRRADAALRPRPLSLMVLQALRLVVLAGLLWAWYGAIGWSGDVAITAAVKAGQEPNLILYCALVIVISLGMFTAWGFVSWYLSVAPLLSMVLDAGPLASLRAAARLGPMRTRLVEVNLVMSIVKIALIVLAMVFSATPLPFQDVTTPEFLAWWWAGVTVLYLVWSDFFHVVRLVAFLDLWKTFQAK